MFTDDRITSCQPQAAPLLLGAEIGIEHLLNICFRDAHSFIFDGDFHIAPRAQRQGLRPTPLVRGIIAAANRQLPAVRHRLHRIDHDIVDHLADLPPVGFDRQQVRGKFEAAAALAAMQRKGGRFPHHFFHRHHLLQRRASFGEGKQLPGQIAGPLAGLLGNAEPGIGLRFRRQPHLAHRNIADDGSQDIVEIVGDPPGQDSHRFQSLGFLQFLLRLQFVGDISERQHPADDVVVFIMDRGGTQGDHPPDGGICLSGDQPAFGHFDQLPAAERFFQGRFRRLVGPVHLDAEHLGDMQTAGPGVRPAGEFFRDLIHHQNPPVGVGGDHPVTDAAQGNREPLTLRRQLFQVTLPLQRAGDMLSNKRQQFLVLLLVADIFAVTLHRQGAKGLLAMLEGHSQPVNRNFAQLFDRSLTDHILDHLLREQQRLSGLHDIFGKPLGPLPLPGAGGEFLVKLIDKIGANDQITHLIVESNIKIIRIHQLPDNPVHRRIKLPHILDVTGAIGNAVQRGLQPGRSLAAGHITHNCMHHLPAPERKQHGGHFRRKAAAVFVHQLHFKIGETVLQQRRPAAGGNLRLARGI